MSIKVSPIGVFVEDTPYKPGVIVGGDASLGDDLDATYAEQWLSFRGGASEGPTIIADFDPYGGGVASVALRMRFEVANELDATGTRFIVSAQHAGLQVGLFHIPGAPSEIPSVPATDTIYDISDWTFEQTSLTTTLNEALIAGLQVRVTRAQEVGSSPLDADFMIRVYELNMLTASGYFPKRIWPAVQNGGTGPTRLWPPPPTRLWPPIH